MPIYEYYCADNHTIYQFYAKTVAQGQTTPKCPDNPKFRLKKLVSAFAITSGGAKDETREKEPAAGAEANDPRMEAAMSAMETEFSNVDENDPKAMARMVRRMSELTGEKVDGQFEEVVRKLEEGTDPESLEETFGSKSEPEDSGDPFGGGMGLDPDMPPHLSEKDPKEPRHRFRSRPTAPRRDPKLYDYE
jgi:hypothetical protein